MKTHITHHYPAARRQRLIARHIVDLSLAAGLTILLVAGVQRQGFGLEMGEAAIFSVAALYSLYAGTAIAFLLLGRPGARIENDELVVKGWFGQFTPHHPSEFRAMSQTTNGSILFRTKTGVFEIADHLSPARTLYDDLKATEGFRDLKDMTHHKPERVMYSALTRQTARRITGLWLLLAGSFSILFALGGASFLFWDDLIGKTLGLVLIIWPIYFFVRSKGCIYDDAMGKDRVIHVKLRGLLFGFDAYPMAGLMAANRETQHDHRTQYFQMPDIVELHFSSGPKMRLRRHDGDPTASSLNRELERRFR